MKNVPRSISIWFLLLAIGLFVMSATLFLQAAAPRDIYCKDCFPTMCPNGGCTVQGSFTTTHCKIWGCDNEEGYVICE